MVGIQYLVGMLVFFFTGGLLAMAIRTELLSPSYHVLSPTAYIQVVGEHGTIMMMMMTSVIVGPFGNYLVPIMIGSKRVAFPRLEALSFWLTPCAYVILLSSFLLGGFPTGWTGYAPLSDPGGRGHGRVRVRVRPDRRLDHPGRLQHHRHDHLLPGARHDAGAGCRCSSGRC